MFDLLRRFGASVRARRLVPARARLRLEELEERDLLSTSPLSPAQVRHAYGVDQANYLVNGRAVNGDGSGQTIAIIDAFHDANAYHDLQMFDRQWGLPDPAFRQYYYGTTANVGWSYETVLDIEWAHAIAPRATIMLVEARSNSFNDLFTAVNWARQQPGVSVMSMSWGGGEFSSESSYDTYFTTPGGHNGITFIASSGDNGAAAGDIYPSVSRNVVSVGGTILSTNSAGAYLGETAWSGSGGGYSRYESEPSYQRTVQSTNVRTSPDVAYNSATPVWCYWTNPTNSSNQGWISLIGTSAGAPQWAGIVAIADQIRVSAGEHTLDGASQTLYALYNSAMNGDFHDITTGSNGYAAHAGYDLATGRGTPIAQRVILDLARVNDSFHGAVARSAALPGSSGAGSFLARTFDEVVSTDFAAPDLAAGAAMQTAGLDAVGCSFVLPGASPGILDAVWSLVDRAQTAIPASAGATALQTATSPLEFASDFVLSDVQALERSDTVGLANALAHVAQSRTLAAETTADGVLSDMDILQMVSL
jgi:hypothetical protein